MKRIMFGFLAVLMLFTTACGATPQPNATEPTDENPGAFNLSDDDTFQIVTPYCVLKYPKKWENTIVTEVTETDLLYTVSYYARFDMVQIPLFSIDIGENSEGYKLGTIETSDGLVTVFMQDYTDENDGTLSSEDEALYMEMCEDVNVIISGLVNECGMLLP